jgi:hypothetical protein
MRIQPVLMLQPSLVIITIVVPTFMVACAPCLLWDISIHNALGRNLLDLGLAMPGVLITIYLLHKVHAFAGLRHLGRRLAVLITRRRQRPPSLPLPSRSFQRRGRK